VVLERIERVRDAGVGEAEPRGYLPWLDTRSALAEDQQAGDREHLGVGDHVGEHGSRPGDRGGQAAVPVVPAFGECGMPVGFQPLPGDVLGLPVSAGDVLVGDVRGAPIVAALAVGDLGQGRQAGTVDATQPLLMPGAQVVAGAGADDHHAGDVLRGGAMPARAQRGGGCGRHGGQQGDGGGQLGQRPAGQGCDPGRGRFRPAARVVGSRGKRSRIGGDLRERE
jgi:hypothetical protein